LKNFFWFCWWWRWRWSPGDGFKPFSLSGEGRFPLNLWPFLYPVE
jgi:hypothetical protein